MTEIFVQERWRSIAEFPNYEISNRGNVYNTKRRREVQTSVTQYGHVKISLFDSDGKRQTRSVALLVAEAFVEAPDPRCNHVVVLDGDLQNVCADNLAWRPNWFAWKYARQLNVLQPRHYHNLPVRDITTGEVYESIIAAGMRNGLLFEDIWRSTYRAEGTYPYGSIFEVI